MCTKGPLNVRLWALIFVTFSPQFVEKLPGNDKIYIEMDDNNYLDNCIPCPI